MSAGCREERYQENTALDTCREEKKMSPEGNMKTDGREGNEREQTDVGFHQQEGRKQRAVERASVLMHHMA